MKSHWVSVEFLLTESITISGYYIPTSIFAIFSMISYFIDPDVVPGRMGLLVTLFLISSNVFNSLKAPSGRGFSYIETWLVGAQGPIIIAIIEYGIILAWKRDGMKSAFKIRQIGEYTLFRNEVLCLMKLYSEMFQKLS